MWEDPRHQGKGQFDLSVQCHMESVHYPNTGNSKNSLSKRIRHLNIRCIFLADKVRKVSLTIRYYPNEAMTAYFISKTLQGDKF